MYRLHRWLGVPTKAAGHKHQVCNRCGVHREWVRGNLQCYIYWYEGLITEPNYERPNCTDNISK